MAFLPVTREEMERLGWDAPDCVCGSSILRSCDYQSASGKPGVPSGDSGAAGLAQYRGFSALWASEAGISRKFRKCGFHGESLFCLSAQKKDGSVFSGRKERQASRPCRDRIL